ncbi:MAG: SH3 domain-containing protein [Chromatiaceae bacterium]
MRSPLLSALAAAAVILASGPASGDADGPDFFAVTGVVRGDVLNIREEPDAHASKLGEIPPDGTCVRNLGCKGGLSFQEFTELSPAEQERRLKQNPRWCKVEYRGITGWVAGRYLREGTCRESQR